MRATPSDLRRARRIAVFSKYVLLPAAVLFLALKVTQTVAWPWWLVLTPSALYLLHPVVIGALGPLLQHLRYRQESRRKSD